MPCCTQQVLPKKFSQTSDYGPKNPPSAPHWTHCSVKCSSKAEADSCGVALGLFSVCYCYSCNYERATGVTLSSSKRRNLPFVWAWDFLLRAANITQSQSVLGALKTLLGSTPFYSSQAIKPCFFFFLPFLHIPPREPTKLKSSLALPSFHHSFFCFPLLPMFLSTLLPPSIQSF